MIRVFVADDFAYGGPAIYIVREHAGDVNTPAARYVMHFGEGGMANWENHEPGTAGQPTMRLDDDTSRALLEALTRYYHGAEDTRALRLDYDAERKRVDKLTDAVIGIASQGASASTA
jgi:hypothetical protein